ncbi:hypothetical protein D9758_000444 [Tetrapyrgos nigripes]|uniref:Heparinase II/III-like C-terminal domain-containing protein n=1 Tax=Tetrapyrgos nigripes TaxID=182062 RepID=A0A8H5LZD9_9AGAR|nr:hypothetical protein D9758_000444 [Tetrapyrgos nigripes]
MSGHNYNYTNNNSAQYSENSPYGSGDPYYAQSTGYITPAPTPKRGTSNWIKFGIPVGIVVIAAAVVGGILGTRNNNNDKTDSSGAASPGSAASAKAELGLFATATDSEWMLPIYPSTTNAAAFTSPTFLPDSNTVKSWPDDPWNPSSPSVTSLRADRPRLIAPSYKWAALPSLIQNDVYLQSWNATIFGNASDWYGQEPVVYNMDGDSGILDNARDIKRRIKAFSYAYRMTNDTKWSDRAWLEVKNAAGNYTTVFGPDVDKWNTQHFLDTAELAAAYAIAYDWLYDRLSDEQKAQMRWTLNLYALEPGVQGFTNPNVWTSWWKTNTTGNWNCVCNNGLTMASLAILGDDDTGNAETLLGLTVDNAKQNCALAVADDGTWAETANYWYFGTTSHSEMTSSLLSATGSHFGLADVNSNFYKTGDFHMYVQGLTSLFNWGDHGPNKFSATANGMILYASLFNQPQYALYQRDQHDAADPWNMFWYDPSVAGAFWDQKPLDAFFNNDLDQWVSMRSSWTDLTGTYVAMKAGMNQGHQTHNDLDAGDFVIDALGTRWAGELGNGDYRSPNYFSNDTQGSDRWLYYRKMTEGQNTILVNKQNQNVEARPKILSSGSSGTKQGSSTVLEVDKSSTAFWVADITSAYFNDVSSAKRGIRLLNGRKQVLIQDEITTTSSFQWRMHTNATVTPSGSSADLELDGQKMTVQILSPSSGASFSTSKAVRFESDPAPPVPDQENPGVTVLIIELPAGAYNLQVLFTPQWGNGFTAVTPKSVNLDGWTLESHN